MRIEKGPKAAGFRTFLKNRVLVILGFRKYIDSMYSNQKKTELLLYSSAKN